MSCHCDCRPSCPYVEWLHPLCCNPAHFCCAGCENGPTLVIHKIVLEPCGGQSCTERTFTLRITGPSESDPRTEVTFAFTGDTDLCEGEIAMAHRVDLLLAESAFEDGRDDARGIHMTGMRAGELAHQAGARRLLLTHLQPWTSPENVRRAAESVFAGPVRAVEPGETYTV